MSQSNAPVLIAGQWRESLAAGTFQADNPTQGEALSDVYPVSSREEVLEAIRAGSESAEALRRTSGETIAQFLEAFASGIEARSEGRFCVEISEPPPPIDQPITPMRVVSTLL